MTKKNIQVLALAAAAAALWTLLTGLGVFRRLDLAASDALYRERRSQDGDIVLIGIDQRDIEALGPFPWSRDVTGEVLETLNVSEDCRPAAIGIDILFSGESGADKLLSEAAGRYGNVVTACLAEYADTLLDDGAGDYTLSTSRFAFLDEPYAALRDVTAQGHINAELDPDGILRYHLLEIALPDGTAVPSMALQLAEMYLDYWGEPPAERPPVRAGRWYLPFCGAPGDFSEGISVVDVLSGAVPAEYFDGKIVLIGPYTEGLNDSYFTSADHTRPMYGVEYHANAVQAILWGSYKQEAGDAVQLAVLFLVLLAYTIGTRRQRVRTFTGLLFLLCGGWLLVCRGLYSAGWVLHVLWIPAGAAVMYVGCLAVNYIRAAMARREVTNRFKRYVAPEIVNEILKEGQNSLALGGKRTHIAVLFVDIRGFTPMSEMLEPAQVVEILNRYLTLISECIFRYGGTLDKFVGDAAMAFWGAPLPQEDYVMNAARAAMDMVRGSQALSEELMAKYGRTVSFGVGIHVGEAVVGNIGSLRRMDYTAIGDTVNTAARLEANAPGGTVYISRAVADALEGRIQTTSLGDSVKLKGKKEGFEVLTLDDILKEEETK